MPGLEELQQISKFVSDHWVAVMLVAGVIVNALNALSAHWSSLTGVARIAGRIVELLSIVKSKDVPGVLKLPLSNKPPEA